MGSSPRWTARGHWLAIAGLCLTACTFPDPAIDDDEPLDSGDDAVASDGGDARAGDSHVDTSRSDTATADAKEDTLSGEEDADASAAETGVEEDTRVEDTTGEDTKGEDTRVTDTTVSDTTGTDTSVADTRASDTYVMDTTTSDTHTSDTTLVDTARVDTSVDTAVDTAAETHPDTFVADDGACCDCDGDGDRADTPTCGGRDCDDTDSRANSFVTAFLPYPPTATTKGDWNCDGHVDMQFASGVSCSLLAVGGACDSTQGFSAAPTCGASSTFVQCKSIIALPPLLSSCGTDSSTTQTQACK